MADTISDFLTIIRNASRARKPVCDAPYSNLKMGIAKILKDVGFIKDVEQTEGDSGFQRISVQLKYVNEVPALTDIQRWSKPGRRMYYKHDNIPWVLDGLGIGILSTSQGLMKDRDARRKKIGGEMVCTVW